ncbi:Transcriptional regulator (Partial), partial [Seminavis robusta]|eukprot:Sro2059_g312880.1 Transcriptional regulator (654) ;mRNA; r:2-1963
MATTTTKSSLSMSMRSSSATASCITETSTSSNTSDFRHSLTSVDDYEQKMDDELLRRTSKPLVFRNVFCGREDEILKLEGIFRRTAAGRSNSPSLVLVSGASGTGKSALVARLRDHLGTTEEEFFWVSGKFEEQQQSHAMMIAEDTCVEEERSGSGVLSSTNSTNSNCSETAPDNLHPFAAIVDAFSHFCRELEEEEPETIEEVKADILEAVGQQGALLTYMIPSLSKIIGEQQAAGETSGEVIRFHYVFRNFIQALATKVRSVVLVLEDLHRADNASLELLHYLFTSKLKHVMFVGTYRSDEVDEEHRFSKWLHGVQEAQQEQQKQQEQSPKQQSNNNNNNNNNNPNTHHHHVTTLGLAEMNLDTINTFISNVLNLSEDETRALAHIVYTKTKGNIFFVTQYLVFLTRNYLLWFDIIKKSWDWDEPAIRKESAVTTTLLDFMRDKLQQSKVAPKILPVAACLGARFHRDTLRMILTGLAQVEALTPLVMAPESDDELVQALKQCEKERYIENCGNKNYSFVHDKVQEAALILHPIIIMQQIRYEAGTVLLRQSNESELDEKLFVVVNLLNAGRLRYDSVSPLEIAKLNLRAAGKAKRLAAFSSASSYVETALASLPPPSHLDAEQLAILLDLWSLGAEVNMAMGRTEITEEYC